MGKNQELDKPQLYSGYDRVDHYFWCGRAVSVEWTAVKAKFWKLSASRVLSRTADTHGPVRDSSCEPGFLTGGIEPEERLTPSISSSSIGGCNRWILVHSRIWAEA